MPPIIKLNIIKEQLIQRPPDLQPNFSPLDGLHLDLLENKKKLRAKLPLIPMKPKKVSPPESPKPTNEEQKPEINAKTSSPKILKKGKNVLQTSNDDMKDFLESEEDKKSNVNDSLEQFGESSSENEIPLPKKKGSVEMSDSGQLPSDEEGSDDDMDEDEEEEDGLTPEEREEIDRKEYLVRFRILKRGNPNYKDFPEYTEHTPLVALKTMYNETVKMIQLEENVDSYKTYLKVGFFIIEFGLCKLGLDFKGFAKIQMKKMDKYERMLIELGEKSYSNFTNNWPVEVRLIGVLLADAIIFYICKIAADYMGNDVVNMLGTMLGVDIPQPEKKPRMRGPSFRPEDIKNL